LPGFALELAALDALEARAEREEGAIAERRPRFDEQPVHEPLDGDRREASPVMKCCPRARAGLPIPRNSNAVNRSVELVPAGEAPRPVVGVAER
jgi:hypothetical protein